MPLDPFVGGSIVSGAAGVLGNVLGGIFGSKSQSSANKTNLQINRENNAFNAEQAQINRDWTESLWNKSNTYNSAVSQRQRLEQAGLNPYLMMNGGNAGVATAQSGTAASAAQSAHMEAYDPLMPLMVRQMLLVQLLIVTMLILSVVIVHNKWLLSPRSWKNKPKIGAFVTFMRDYVNSMRLINYLMIQTIPLNLIC